MDIHFHASFNQKITIVACNVRCNKCLNNADAGTLTHPTKCRNLKKTTTTYIQNLFTQFSLLQYPHSFKYFFYSVSQCQNEGKEAVMGCQNMPVQCKYTQCSQPFKEVILMSMKYVWQKDLKASINYSEINSFSFHLLSCSSITRLRVTCMFSKIFYKAIRPWKNKET